MSNDSLRELGTLALGSRLRRLSDQLMGDVAQNYVVAGVEFKPAWFPVLHELALAGSARLGDVAARVGISHVAVNRTASELEALGLVRSRKDDQDARARVLELTDEGRQRVEQAETVWGPSREAMDDVLAESVPDFVDFIAKVEDALERRSLHKRFTDLWDEVEIVPFNADLVTAFSELNRRWIEQLFTLEPSDAAALDDPQSHILDVDGAIFFAVLRRTGKVVGTGALMPHGDGWEMAKMAVDPAFQGKGIGRMVADAIIAEARSRGLAEIVLESNSSLKPAIRLYESLGFEHRPNPNHSAYIRSDVYMVLPL